MRVLVTRPQPQADQWVRKLAALGVQAVGVPLLDIGAPADPEAVLQAWSRLATYRAVMFVSPNAVERFFAASPGGAPWPEGVWAAGTGPGTQAALVQAGVRRAQVLSPPADGGKFDSESLWPLLAERGPWAGASMLIVRGEGGRDWLSDRLRAEGAVVHFVEAYRRLEPQWDAEATQAVADALARPADHVWLLSSSEAARHLPRLQPGADWSACRALATHTRIAEAAVEVGFGDVVTVAPTPEAVSAWLTRSIQSPRS
jgi:uroporphyrinogen-III synthase